MFPLKVVIFHSYVSLPEGRPSRHIPTIRLKIALTEHSKGTTLKSDAKKKRIFPIRRYLWGVPRRTPSSNTHTRTHTHIRKHVTEKTHPAAGQEALRSCCWKSR